ncbi:hypothetical protein NL676_037496 [Syzygium grande]|nr:hypothetical protein NL676_037496 [Syzygium grande]
MHVLRILRDTWFVVFVVAAARICMHGMRLLDVLPGFRICGSFLGVIFPDAKLLVKQVLFEEISSVRKMILNRPTKLNCLTYEMVVQMLRALEAYECDSAVECITLKAKDGRRGPTPSQSLSSNPPHSTDISTVVMLPIETLAAALSLRSQLMLDYLIATYSKPVIALVDGIVMGGGAGLAMHAAFCVVTENTVFAMPEASIGLFPDVGASKFLSKLPGSFGEYLALTGARLGGGEMLACGLASHFVLSKDLPLLEKSVCEEAPLKKSTISDLLNRFAHKPSLKENSAFRRLEIINRCFSKPTVEEILSSLENEVENDGEKKWIKDAIRSMRSASPTSLKITLKSIREGRAQTIEQCLAHEYTISCHMVRRSMHRDLYEGSRAMLFDKDRKPRWDPPKLESITDEMVGKFFTGLAGIDPHWVDLKLPIRSGRTVARARL